MNLRYQAIIVSVLIVTGCSSKDSTSPANGAAPGASNASTATSNPPATAAVKAKVDVCGLLTSDDLKSVQGEAYQDAKRSDRQDGEFIVAQCYYAMPTTANSVVLNVTESGGKTTPRQFWEQSFGKDEGAEKSDKEKEKEKERAQKNKTRERGEENEEEGPKPEKISGLGDEAFWLASHVGGALYVLKGDRFFRISVGGAGDAKSKLNKSKTLAQQVLKKI